jgi:hypothetical protein
LKVIDAAIKKRFIQRDWASMAMLCGFTVGTAGTILIMKAFRKDWAVSLRPGLPEGEFTRLLEGFEMQGGRSAHFQSVYYELAGLGFIENGTGYRVVLTPEAKRFLNSKLK